MKAPALEQFFLAQFHFHYHHTHHLYVSERCDLQDAAATRVAYGALPALPNPVYRQTGIPWHPLGLPSESTFAWGWKVLSIV